jgi:RNA polymerase sigma factor (sigma-70 family)
MSPGNQGGPSELRGAADFDTTHWSVVLTAGHRSSPDSRKALSTLCQAYWYPLYAYARRRGRNVEEAQDLTQEFFARLLEKDYLAVAQPGRGRFRSFLLTAFKHFLANEWDKARAQKRGGGCAPISLDFATGESRYLREPADELTPERIYERQWALTLLEQVLARLRDEFVRAGKADLFEQLKVFITPRTTADCYAEAAGELSISQEAVRVAVHRLRRRYRQLLRAEISQTVAEPSDVEDEIRSLFSALGSQNPRKSL